MRASQVPETPTNPQARPLFGSVFVTPWRRQRVGPSLSFMGHFMVLACLSLPSFLVMKKDDPPKYHVIRLVAPPSIKKPPPPSELITQTTQSAINQDFAEPDDTPDADSGLAIKIKHDPDENLGAVLQAQGGHLGFGQPNDKKYFQYLIDATDWRRVQQDRALFSLEGYFVLRIRRPERWKFIEAARAQNGIPNGLTAYALFPLPLYDSVDTAMREEMKSNSQAAELEPSRIEIAFSSASARGFQLRVLATKPISPGR